MIKKLLSLSSLLFCLVAGSATAEFKIAVIDTQRALIASEEAQSLSKQIQEELQSDEANAKALSEEVRELSEKLQKDAEVMSPAEQRKAQKVIDNKQIDLQFIVNKYQKAVQDRQQELVNHMLPKIDAVLKDLIELEGYDVIMDRRNIYYVNTKHDITRKVTEKLNEKYEKS